MSIDSSLKIAGSLTKHRNVLTRAERIERLSAKDLFNLEDSDPLGLPKVANRKVVTGGKAKKAAEAEADEATGTPVEGAESAAAPADS